MGIDINTIKSTTGMTINELATSEGIQPRSLQRRILRNDFGTFGLDEPLDEKVVEWVRKGKKVERKEERVVSRPLVDKNGEVNLKEVVRKHYAPPPSKKSITKSRLLLGAIEAINWMKVLPVLPLPMLGLAASYGVYFFAVQFVPVWIAIGEAMAFELTYVGLASMKGLNEKLQKRARRVSLGAVGVSVIYNTLAGAIHQNPEIFKDLSLFWFWTLAVVHGAPLAILAYLVSDLIFHQKK